MVPLGQSTLNKCRINIKLSDTQFLSKRIPAFYMIYHINSEHFQVTIANKFIVYVYYTVRKQSV